ncbi:antibiotic biosynthesis monooxygenase [Lichenihabitans sp. PAMC28606]|uniref:antibiotic biosynthesis monooxygenase family protein n=1 Tax=Lichenihabitans sp. PAMC28606 TaxID=2880932 RepID=UPI001D0B543E|nr:antibiotic biosynthesis monooxygenase [Lichenihabitans sp. PAMC28606]UDL95070.1 antibiotic biosynthesis monooxygenase [Lichenihabitans sp. PAMC28606]
MIAVIFEVELAEDGRQDYLALAAALRRDLEAIDGFLSVERFQSVSASNRMVSLSFFRDQEAVRRWRNSRAHRSTQIRGRSSVFTDYRLRVAEVIRDYGMNDRDEAPPDSLLVHPTGDTKAE